MKHLIGLVLATLALAACAGRPLDLYTLDVPISQAPAPAGVISSTLAVARVDIPLELDNDDMLVAEGSKYRRSETGRWASRLSALVTRRLSQRIAEARPGILVTDQAAGSLPDLRLLVRVSTLAVNADGTCRIEADWRIFGPGTAVRQQRFGESITQPVSGDQRFHDDMTRLLDDLATEIAASLPAA